MAPTSAATATATSFEAEIRQCFDVLDEERTGTITPHALTTLLQSLGQRINRDDVMAELDAARQRRRRRRSRSGQGDDDGGPDDDENDGYNNGRIDVELVLDVCRHASSGSTGSTATASTRAANLQQTFRLFDIDDKGIITLDNLRKVADEIYGNETNAASSNSRGSSIDDDLLKSMIETFDGDLTDGISFEEFCRIMER